MVKILQKKLNFSKAVKADMLKGMKQLQNLNILIAECMLEQ